MLLSISSAVIIEAHLEEGYDAEHGLNKQRNDNSYDGRLDDCVEEFAPDANRGVDDEYDKKHNLNKKRNSETHPICTEVCSEKIETIAHPVCTDTCSKTLEKVEQAAEQRAQVKEEIGEIKAELKKDILAMEEAQPAEVIEVKVQEAQMG